MTLGTTTADAIKQELCALVEARRVEINAGIRSMVIDIECNVHTGEIRVFDTMKRERRKEERTIVPARRSV